MVKVEIPEHLRTVDWERVPKPGLRLMGLTRTTLLEVIKDPQSEVRSAVIRKPGRARGIRLIYMPSLFAYLHRLAGLEADSENESVVEITGGEAASRSQN